ncbi:MAG: DUF4249 domain-containing protein [Chitinophagaceae bacterium]|nr:MAG: DUF4249 domain-containing protein [Chitinophagaceae bacterium]
MTRILTLAAQSLLLVLLFTACQKEVDIDLKSARSNIVITGEITDQPGPYTIKINRTVNFNEPNTFPAISGATVVVSDSEGNSETLIETEPGIYTGTTLQGVPGRSYTLTINANGENYSAVSRMPVAVEIDTITFEKGFFADEDDEKLTEVEFTDPAGTENFYRMILIQNGTRMRDIYIAEDRLRDGQVLSATLFRDGDDENRYEEFKSGDQVTVLLQSIDESTHNFFRTFDTPGGGDGSASPANPLNNLTNGALGYFSAAAVRSKSVVYP